jgi:hypothetical protein
MFRAYSASSKICIAVHCRKKLLQVETDQDVEQKFGIHSQWIV